MNTLKKRIPLLLPLLMLAVEALPTFADIPVDPDGDGIPTGRDVCPLAYGEGSDGCPTGNYAAGHQPVLQTCPNRYESPPCWAVAGDITADVDAQQTASIALPSLLMQANKAKQ